MPHTPRLCLRWLRTPSLVAVTAAATFGCAYPRTVHVYDEACQITARQMVLDVTDLQTIQSCSGNHCVFQLVGQAAVLAASTVISGSIVVTGNVVYWLEKKRDCRPKPELSDAPAPV